MAHYAQVVNGVVTQVIVADEGFIKSGIMGNPLDWIQTSYNTREGVHIGGGDPFRGNFAGIGFVYDSRLDAFYPPQPYPSWTLDTEKYNWVPPVPRPSDLRKIWIWNEEAQQWDGNFNEFAITTTITADVFSGKGASVLPVADTTKFEVDRIVRGTNIDSNIIAVDAQANTITIYPGVSGHVPEGTEVTTIWIPSE